MPLGRNVFVVAVLGSVYGCAPAGSPPELSGAVCAPSTLTRDQTTVVRCSFRMADADDDLESLLTEAADPLQLVSFSTGLPLDAGGRLEHHEQGLIDNIEINVRGVEVGTGELFFSLEDAKGNTSDKVSVTFNVVAP